MTAVAQATQVPAWQSLVLDLLSPARPVDQARVDALTADDWRWLLGAVHEHRIGPLLHWQLAHARAGLKLPPDVVRDIADSHQVATLRSLQVQRELLLTHQVLQRAGLAHMALKGAALAWHAYPHPALRPLRDLDILVPSDQALRAYQVLLEAGLSRKPHCQGQAEAMMAVHRHLPPLLSPSGTITVELHSRLFHPPEHGSGPPDLSESPGFWPRATSLRLAQSCIAVASPTDQLLHLIVHAVYDHEFSNGPLLLSDLAFLLDLHPVDWPLFWKLAEQGHHTRGCVLALSLLQQYWGPQPVDWLGHAPDETAAWAARTGVVAVLMLSDRATRLQRNLQSHLQEQGSFLGRAHYLIQKLCPPRLQMAAEYPVAARDWRVFLWYPVRWWRLLRERWPGVIRRQRFDRIPGEAGQLRHLRQWLKFPGA